MQPQIGRDLHYFGAYFELLKKQSLSEERFIVIKSYAYLDGTDAPLNSFVRRD